jgi:hypothetical protein
LTRSVIAEPGAAGLVEEFSEPSTFRMAKMAGDVEVAGICTRFDVLPPEVTAN